MALVSTAGAAVADGYGGYMAARFFQGLGVSPGSTVGMAVGTSSYLFIASKVPSVCMLIAERVKSVICSLIMNEDKSWDCGFWPSIRVYCLVRHVSVQTP